MNQLKMFFAFIFLITMNIKTGQAQCTEFVTTKGFEALDTSNYIPEGRFDAMILSQGDFLKVYKSFFRGKTYRIAVIADKNIPHLTFQVKSMQGEIIYDNSNAENLNTWDYTSDKNQNLIIKVTLPPANNIKPKSGCVAVLLGNKF